MGALGAGGLSRRRPDWRGKWDRLLEDGRRRVHPADSPFPTEAQLDLLKAALLPADQAAPAWRRWKTRGLELQTVQDDASMRLFSLLWSNRDAAGVDAEDLPLLKGVYRHTISYNATTLANALKVSELFEAAGIPVLFLKGAAVIAMFDGRLGYRRINDVDVLVPEDDATRASEMMATAGYAADAESRPVGFSHARGYRAPTGAAIDLHWWAFKSAGDDSTMFETARQATLLERPVLIPSPTECLISAVGNAFEVWNAPRLRWIADAMVILGTAEIDWEYLLERARRPGLTLRLAAGLDFLSREFGAFIPAHVIGELRRRPVDWRERDAFWAAVHRPPVGLFTLEQLDRHRARRLHFPTQPRDYLWHVAQMRGRRRRDVVPAAPLRALRTVAVLVVRMSGGSLARSRRN